MKTLLKRLFCAVLLFALLVSFTPLDAIAASIERPVSAPLTPGKPVVYDDTLPVGDAGDSSDQPLAPEPPAGNTLSAQPDSTPAAQPDSTAGQAVGNTQPLRYPELADTQSDYYESLYGDPVYVGQYETVYQIDAMTFKAVVSPVPNTYFNEAGIEEPIDNSLFLAESDGAPVFENFSNALEVEIPAAFARGDGPSVTVDGQTVRLIPLDGDFSTAVVSENAVRYNNVFENIDVQYTVQEYQVKEDIILLAPTGRHAFRYRIDAPGLEARIVDGVVGLYDETGQEIFTIIAPVMTDADNAYSFKLSMSIDGDILTLTADSAWLNDAARVYPVKIDPTVVSAKIAQASGMFSPGASFYYQSVGHCVAGWAYKSWCGYPEDAFQNTNIIRSFLSFDNLFSDFTEDIEIDSAVFKIYKYEDLSNGATTFELHRALSNRSFAEVDANYSWTYIQSTPREYLGSFGGANGFHTVDITEVVNNWQKGVYPNYGLMLMSNPESPATLGARFYPAIGSEADHPPVVELTWHVVGEVPDSYPLEDLTVELRPITVSDLDGRLEFIGATWDGVGKPHGDVNYALNDSDKGYDGTAPAGNEYLYPNTILYEAGLPAGATNYRRRLSNWQTLLPFVDHEYDTEYWLEASVTLHSSTSTVKTSDTYIVYKVKQFDTLPNIAAYYGVDFEQLARDNHIVDRLVVENNTIFIRNPQQNQDQPYNPPALTDEQKMEIDLLLMARGLHCEFGFEPINLNTGNFFYEAEDATVPDYGGAFSLLRAYNSKAAGINSVFGRGWAFSYDEKLTGLSDGTIVYHRGDGSAVWVPARRQRRLHRAGRNLPDAGQDPKRQQNGGLRHNRQRRADHPCLQLHRHRPAGRVPRL